MVLGHPEGSLLKAFHKESSVKLEPSRCVCMCVCKHACVRVSGAHTLACGQCVSVELVLLLCVAEVSVEGTTQCADLCPCLQAFWGVVNNITPVEQLEERSGYHLMREGVVPTWEGNARGGYWSMMCPKKRTVRADHAHMAVICINNVT